MVIGVSYFLLLLLFFCFVNERVYFYIGYSRNSNRFHLNCTDRKKQYDYDVRRNWIQNNITSFNIQFVDFKLILTGGFFF